MLYPFVLTYVVAMYFQARDEGQLIDAVLGWPRQAPTGPPAYSAPAAPYQRGAAAAAAAVRLAAAPPPPPAVDQGQAYAPAPPPLVAAGPSCDAAPGRGAAGAADRGDAAGGARSAGAATRSRRRPSLRPGWG